MKEVLGKVGVPVQEELRLYGDNAAANLLARKDGDLRKIRHVSLANQEQLANHFSILPVDQIWVLVDEGCNLSKR